MLKSKTTIIKLCSIVQMVNVECVQDFTEQPDLNCTFYYNGNPTTIKCKLPISINKFIEPTEMTSEVRQERYALRILFF